MMEYGPTFSSDVNDEIIIIITFSNNVTIVNVTVTVFIGFRTH